MSTIYAITTTNGAHLRAMMREATDETVDDVLAKAASYIGATGEIERLDGGDVVLGPLVARPVGCESGEATGEACSSVANTTIEWMPEHLRESHRAAGNSGQYPANGALRLHVCDECAAALAEDDD